MNRTVLKDYDTEVENWEKRLAYVKMNFDYHTNQLCKTGNKKLYAIGAVFWRISFNLSCGLKKIHVIFGFLHLPFIWRIRSRYRNGNTNKSNE